MALTLKTKKGVAAQQTELSCMQEWDAFFRLHNPLLSRLCVRWARGHRADAEDLLGEAYLRAIAATRQGILPPDNPVAWVSSIIANLARDHLRAQSRATTLKSCDRATFELLHAPTEASDTLLATRELLRSAQHHLRTLCPAQRGALLARSAGHDYETIAANLGTSPANARKLVQTARSELRERL